MGTQSHLDEHDINELRALMAGQLLNITTTMAMAEGVDSGKVPQMATPGSDGAQQHISARLMEQLASVEFSIYELESTRPRSEFIRGLDAVLGELRQRRRQLVSLFEVIPADQQPIYWSEDVVRELDGLARLLRNFRPSLGPIQSGSDSRWDHQNTAKNLFRKFMSAPLKAEETLEEARNNVSAVMATLARLQASTEPLAELYEAQLAEASSSRQGDWV